MFYYSTQTPYYSCPTLSHTTSKDAFFFFFFLEMLEKLCCFLDMCQIPRKRKVYFEILDMLLKLFVELPICCLLTNSKVNLGCFFKSVNGR